MTYLKLFITATVPIECNGLIELQSKELGPRTAKLALLICLKLKMIEYV